MLTCSACLTEVTSTPTEHGQLCWTHFDGSALCSPRSISSETQSLKQPKSRVRKLAKRYHKARGTKPKGIPTGRKLLEETGELLRALALEDRFDIWCEIGDVAICLAYIAHKNGTSVEECMKIKTEKDRGRG